jgi:hypothetical protein
MFPWILVTNKYFLGYGYAISIEFRSVEERSQEKID